MSCPVNLHSQAGTRLRAGVTLLELAVVLVIVGLIAAAAVIGRDMVNATYRKRIIDGKNQYLTALNLFQSRYGQWAGDYDNAYGALNGVVGGNGNGVIAYVDAATDLWSEVNNVYAHLGAAGLLDKAYATASIHLSQPSVWNIDTDAPQAPLSYPAVFWIGSQNSATYGRPALRFNTITLTGRDTREGALSLEETRLIDAKYDDGMASTGDIRAYRTSGGIVAGNLCVDNTSGAAVANYLPANTSGSNNRDCIVELTTF